MWLVWFLLGAINSGIVTAILSQYVMPGKTSVWIGFTAGIILFVLGCFIIVLRKCILWGKIGPFPHLSHVDILQKREEKRQTKR